MFSSWKIGRVAGINLYLHSTFVIALAWPIVNGQGLLGLLFVLTLFGSVLLHELGHAIAAKGFGIPTKDITLYPIGGVARLSRMPRAPGAEMFIALAGPAVNVAIAIALAAPLWLLGMVSPAIGMELWVRFLWSICVMNVGLALFNLIPAFPMDGGRVLRALLSSRFGRLRATEVAATIGQTLAVLFGLYFISHGLWIQTILAIFIYFVAGAELSQVRSEEARRGPSDPVNVAPPGYSWVYRGNGVWQLARLTVDDRTDRIYTNRGSQSWI